MPTPRKAATAKTANKARTADVNAPQRATARTAAPPSTEEPTTTAGGSPAAAEGAKAEQVATDKRLETQRKVAEERAEAAAAARPGNLPATGVYTAVCKNGLSHRRNGIIFGAEPVSVDTTDWTPEERERFFNDSMLMIIAGVQLGAKGAQLANIPSNVVTGHKGENATPEMVAAAGRGEALAHPSTGSASPVVGAGNTQAARDLEKLIASDEGDDKDEADDE